MWRKDNIGDCVDCEVLDNDSFDVRWLLRCVMCLSTARQRHMT
jgi:hypothetical protein